MIYQDLLDELLNLDEEQLQQTVTIFSQDEFVSVSHTEITNEADILDENHYYLVLNN